MMRQTKQQLLKAQQEAAAKVRASAAMAQEAAATSAEMQRVAEAVKAELSAVSVEVSHTRCQPFQATALLVL